MQKITNTNDLKKAILEFGKENIFFDFFDTIVHRKVHPENIKKIACDRLLKHYQCKSLSYESVYNIRAEIERHLCFKNHDNGFDLEFRFDEMSILLYNRLKGAIDKVPEAEDFINECRQIEFEAELTNQFTDISVVNCIKELHAGGYKIYVCSDIYLDSGTIYKLLAAHGLSGYIEDVFVSSVYGLTKRSGRLYDKVLENFNPEKCIMIGDNYESDFVRAGERKMSAIHIDRSWMHAQYEKYQTRFHPNSFSQKIDQFYKTYSNVHFKEFSLTAFYFTHLLYSDLKAKGYKEVFFLAREGQIMKEIFDTYQEICRPGADIITSHYLKVSRRSTFLPSLKKLEKENFFTLFRQYRKISTEEFLYSLGFSNEDICKLANSVNIDRTKRERDFPTSEAFIKLMISDEFYSMYEKRRCYQKEAFKKYFNSFSNIDKANIALVDVGWKGTIQDNIYAILDGVSSVEGFYMGLVVSPPNDNPRNIKGGLLFSIDKKDDYYDIFNENRSFFEVFFAANHGSTLCYHICNNGRPYAETEDYSDEENFYKSKTYPLINSILPIFKDICTEYNSHCISYEELYELVARNHARMFLFPSQEELAWYMDLYHVENFGVFGKSEFGKRGKRVYILDRMSSYYAYKKYPQSFVTDVIWPAAEFSKHGLHRSGKKYSKHKFSSIFN